MKIRILLGIVAALATLASSGCAIDRYSLDSSNLAACKQVVQADDQWRTDPAFKIVYATQSQDGKRVFWDVHNPGNTVVIGLKDERYNELIVEVADPKAAVELVKTALPR